MLLFYISKEECDFGQDPKQDFQNLNRWVGKVSQLNEMVQATSKILKTFKPQTKLVKDNETVLDCITLFLAPGHTPGHILTTIHSKSESL